MALSAWQQQSEPRRMDCRQYVEKSGALIERSVMTRPSKLVHVHPLLADIVEQIVDWDVPDDNVARAMTPKALPSTTPYLIAQYRVPLRSDRHFGSSGYRHRQHRHMITVAGTGVVTVRPSGPLGVLIVRLKPEAATRLVGCGLQEFVNEKIDLCDVFNAGDVSLLEEMLMEAPDTSSRFAHIESFLLRNLRQCPADSAVCKAAQYLRRNPSLRVRGLAAKLNVCERHLSRGFRAMFGASPKHFARVARIEKIMAMRQAGSAWADIAYACGFADQAHMINDFDALVGETPQQLFRASALDVDWQNLPIGQPAGPTFVGY
jgi:AraC-like DNA-binding protein